MNDVSYTQRICNSDIDMKERHKRNDESLGE